MKKILTSPHSIPSVFDPECSARDALELISGKWSVLVMSAHDTTRQGNPGGDYGTMMLMPVPANLSIAMSAAGASASVSVLPSSFRGASLPARIISIIAG